MFNFWVLITKASLWARAWVIRYPLKNSTGGLGVAFVHQLPFRKNFVTWRCSEFKSLTLQKQVNCIGIDKAKFPSPKQKSTRNFTSGWWFEIFFIFTPIWGNDPIWLIFFKWVETTNQTSLGSSFWMESIQPFFFFLAHLIEPVWITAYVREVSPTPPK